MIPDEVLDLLAAAQSDVEYMGQGHNCDARLERAKRIRDILKENGRPVPEPGTHLKDVFNRTYHTDMEGRKNGVYLLSTGDGPGDYCVLVNSRLAVIRHGTRAWVEKEMDVHALPLRQEFRIGRRYDLVIEKPQEIEQYPLSACVWKRASTDEWVLELSGAIRDTALISRHAVPSTCEPEDVPGLMHHYALLHEFQEFFENLEGAFDTPVARRKLSGEHSNETREQMRSLKARLDELL